MPEPTDTPHDERTCPDCSRVIEETGGRYLPPPAPEPGADAALTEALQEVPHFEVCAGLRGPNDCDCGVKVALLRLRAALARPTPALDVEGLINDLYDAIFAIPIREVDPDTGKVTPADPEEVRDAALGAVILARLAARATEGGTDR